MGTLLDKPETTKESKEEEGNGIQYGVCSMQGDSRFGCLRVRA